MQAQELMLSSKEIKLVKKLFNAFLDTDLEDFSMVFPRDSSPVSVYLDMSTEEPTLVIERSDYGGTFALERYASLQDFKQAYEVSYP
jgi:hypothetical protein